MSVYIKGMEMPTGCVNCPLNFDATCNLIPFGFPDETNGSERRPNCPLVPVPEHGRLIDADVLFDFILNIYKNAKGDARKAYSDVLDTIVAAGDVIPASKEGEG